LIAFNSVRGAWQEGALVFGVSAFAFVFNFVAFMLIYRNGYPAMSQKFAGQASPSSSIIASGSFSAFLARHDFQRLSRPIRTTPYFAI
jgi:hypothetical protein